MEHVNTREARGVLTVRIAVDMKIDVVAASISCLGKFPTNHGRLHPNRSNYRVSRRLTKNIKLSS